MQKGVLFVSMRKKYLVLSKIVYIHACMRIYGLIYLLIYLFYGWNTKILPVTKLWYLVKIQFLSITCQDITVVMTTSVSANRKRTSKDLAIGVYIINRILHAGLWIRILSSRVQLDISLVRASWTLEHKIRIHARACNILYIRPM